MVSALYVTVHVFMFRMYMFVINALYIFSESWWLREFNLLKEDKAVLESTEWLNDKIIQAAQDLLQKKSDMDGFQNPLLGLKFKPVKATSPFEASMHFLQSCYEAANIQCCRCNEAEELVRLWAVCYSSGH